MSYTNQSMFKHECKKMVFFRKLWGAETKLSKRLGKSTAYKQKGNVNIWGPFFNFHNSWNIYFSTGCQNTYVCFVAFFFTSAWIKCLRNEICRKWKKGPQIICSCSCVPNFIILGPWEPIHSLPQSSHVHDLH